MSTVLDASALVALLAGEPGAGAVAQVAPAGAISAVNLAEVRDHLSRVTGDPVGVAAALDQAIALGLRIVACDRSLAESAADVRAEHYHRSFTPVSLADCFAIAAAVRAGGPLVSSDVAQLRVAERVGVVRHAIANSQGIVPEV